jgi:hypothetical protein
MFDDDDTTTVSKSDVDEDQILFLNGSQRRGNFVESNKPHRGAKRKTGSRQFPRRPFKDYA